MKEITKKLKTEIIQQIGKSSSVERDIFAKEIIENKLPISDLLDILLLEHPVSTRFSWLLGDISSRQPSFAPVILVFCFQNIQRIKIKDIDRVVAKQSYLCGAKNIPEAIEGELVDQLFEWLIDSKSSVSTKSFSLWALDQLCEKYPDLRIELNLAIQDQLELHSKGFKNRALKVLNKN